jgi:hypothetical protein
MAVTAFHDLPLADRDRRWDGGAAEKRVRTWAGAQDEPNEKYRDAHLWYDADSKDNFTAYKLLVAGRSVLVTSRKPDDLPAFCDALVTQFSQAEPA